MALPRPGGPPPYPGPGAPAGSVSAPTAPGRLGAPVDASAAMTYLDELGSWLSARQAELDQLDQAALNASTGSGPSMATGSSATGDILLSMALWKAVSDRYALLLATWDSGRVGQTERLQLASLIWGRLDAAAASGLTVSLPEACRLSDALVSQLRVKLGLDPSGAEITERIRQLRHQMERIRDQTDLEPAGEAQQRAAEKQSRLARRLKEIADRAGRGGDVGGMLGPLEIEAATFERDLIVGGAQRREAAGLVQRARDQRAELAARAAALTTIANRAVSTVDPAPRYAIPDVAALGPIPNTPDRLNEYVRRLDQVGRALTLAQTAYTKALTDHEELVGRLDAYRVKAEATGVADLPELRQAHELARAALSARPCRMIIAEQLVTLFQTYLQTTPAPTSAGPKTTRSAAEAP